MPTIPATPARPEPAPATSHGPETRHPEPRRPAPALGGTVPAPRPPATWFPAAAREGAAPPAPPRRARWMTGRGFRTLTVTQARLLLREPAALIWLALPPSLLVLFGNISSFRVPVDAFGGRSVLDVYVPTIAAMTPLFLACTALPMTMAQLREKGVLRRLSVSPVPAAGMLGALLAVIAVLSAAGAALIAAVGAFAFHVRPPAHAAVACAAFTLAAAAVLALGLVIAAVAPTSGAAAGAGVPLMVLNFFFGGLYVPVAELPHALRLAGQYVPLGAATSAWSGDGPAWRLLLVPAVYTLAGGLVAARLFRWE